MTRFIEIRGARVNNLKNLNLDIPINRITCFYGPSGSGKSSIAFHTLYTESKRRFLNSFPTYLKFFSERPAPVDVDSITPVLPVFGLPQINPVSGSRPCVADIMQFTNLVQGHYFYYSKEICPIHKEPIVERSFSDFIGPLLKNESDIYHIFIKGKDFIDYFGHTPFPSRSLKNLRSKEVSSFELKHKYFEIARFKSKHLSKLNEQMDPFLKYPIELIFLAKENFEISKIQFVSGQLGCTVPGCKTMGLENKKMMHFSPYSPLGACEECGGFGETLDYDQEKLVDSKLSVSNAGIKLLEYKRFSGQLEILLSEMKKKKISTELPIEKLDDRFWKLLYEGSNGYYGFNEYFKFLESSKYKMSVRIFIRNIQKSTLCKKCSGSRLKQHAKNFYLDKEFKFSMAEVMNFTLFDLATYFGNLSEGKKSLDKINKIVSVAIKIGLGHLKLLRKAKSLSAGEYQRLLLLKFLSYEGTESLFIFDEPSLGLDDHQLAAIMLGFRELIEQGNTVMLVDHNEYIHKHSDYLIEMGPGAGTNGGEIIFAGQKRKQSKKDISSTLSVKKVHSKGEIKVFSPEIYGKKYPNQIIKIGVINCVKGESGSGKTGLFINTIANQLLFECEGEYLKVDKGIFKKLSNPMRFENVIIVDANLNRYTSRSSVGSITGLFPIVRKHFLNTPIARSMNLSDGHLSYNSQLGQCPRCEGRGHLIVEMQFLEDIILKCDDCNGQKLKRQYASLSDGEVTVDEAYNLPLGDILERIKLTPKFKRVYEYIKILNLDYLSLNRQVNSLSGGERQRIYLLSRVVKNLENSILFFENLSFGLSVSELSAQAEFIQDLNKKNNTIVIIDQHPIFQRVAHHLIKL